MNNKAMLNFRIFEFADFQSVELERFAGNFQFRQFADSIIQKSK